MVLSHFTDHPGLCADLIKRKHLDDRMQKYKSHSREIVGGALLIMEHNVLIFTKEFGWI